MFNRKQFDRAIQDVATKYERSAPTICDWCDFLAAAKDDQVTLADLHLLQRLATEDTQANYAANLVYHRMDAAGQLTTGHAGF
jgi:hypothetical protein